MSNANKNEYGTRIDATETVTIASGESESTVIDCGGMIIVGIDIPSDFDGTSISFKSAVSENGNFVALQNQDGIVFTAKVLPDYGTRWDTIDFRGDRFIKLVSNAAETSDRIITLRLIAIT